MKENKKIEKELLFKNNIKDITSISLDSTYKIEDNQIIGNFIINGDYKIHEVSLNREKFNFKIPFKQTIEKDIDTETIKLEITNFEYDFRKDELLVNIEYEINGDRKDVLIFDDEESLDEFLTNRKVEVIDTRIDDLKEEIINKEESETLEIKEEIINKEESEIPETKEEIINKEPTEKNIEKEINLDRNINVEEIKEEIIKPDEIINSIDKPKDNFITYKIYKIQENDTLESIVLKYKTNVEELKEYNDLNNIQINDKIIIPYYE